MSFRAVLWLFIALAGAVLYSHLINTSAYSSFASVLASPTPLDRGLLAFSSPAYYQ